MTFIWSCWGGFLSHPNTDVCSQSLSPLSLPPHTLSLSPVAVSLDWSRGVAKMHWKWKREEWVRWSRAQDSSRLRIVAPRLKIWVAGLLCFSTYKWRPRVVSLSDLAREPRLGGDSSLPLLGQRTTSHAEFSLQALPWSRLASGCLADSLPECPTPRSRCHLKVCFSPYHPLKKNSQLGFFWVTPRQRLNSSFSHDEWKAGKAEI